MSLSSVASANDNVFAYLREKYDDLPEKGKFAAGVTIGFTGSRLAIKSATTVVKVTGAAFVATEVLSAVGVLDEIPSLSEEQTEVAQQLKQRAVAFANNFRSTIRRRLNTDNIKRLMETDRMVTMGVATGAFVGFIV